MPAPVHLLITLRRKIWRVRILSGGVICWRAYRVADYPTPEAVARRCAEGLVLHDQPKNETHEGEKSDGGESIRPAHVRPPLLRVRWECWGWL